MDTNKEILIEQCIDILHEKDQLCVLASVLDTGYPLASVNRPAGGIGLKQIYFIFSNTSAIVTSFEKNEKGSVTFYSGDNSVHLTGNVSIVSTEKHCKDETDAHFFEDVDANHMLLKFVTHKSHINISGQYHVLEM